MNSLQDLDLQSEVNRSKYSKTTLPRFASIPHFSLNTNQESVTLNQQKLMILPPNLNTLIKLKILNLNDNFIKVLDYAILEDLHFLEVFTIRNNLLQEFYYLPSWKQTLKSLDISQNHIKVIRPQIGTLLNLEHLYIAHNSFMEIPKQLTQLKYSLFTFQLDWFKYSDPPSSEYFQSQEIIFSLLSTIEAACGKNEQISAKTLLNCIQYKQFTLKFQAKNSITYKLHQSILDEDIGMLRVMLSEPKKYCVDQLNIDGYSPLGLSILEEKYLASRYLIYANADPNKGGSWFAGCINLAVSKLQYYLVFDLLKRGAKITQVDIYGNNAMHYLCCVYCLNELEAQKILELLLENGIHQNQCNQYGYAPLHLAVQKGMLNLIEYLYEFSEQNQEYRFNFNQKTEKEKNTCLHLAVITRQIVLVKFFVQKFQEQIFAKNKQDLTPIDYLKNDLTIYKYLRGFTKVLCVNQLRQTKVQIVQQYSIDFPSQGSLEEVSIQMNQSHKFGSSCDIKLDIESRGGNQSKSQQRINEIVRQIPLSPNNLKRLEEKNTMINVKESKIKQAQIYKAIKRICYEFEVAQHNLLIDLLEAQLEDHIGDYIYIKKLFYYLNCIKNIIDMDTTNKRQWEFQLRHLKYQQQQQQQLSSTCQQVKSEKTLDSPNSILNQNNLFKIFNHLIKKIEKVYFEYQVSDIIKNFIVNYFFSMHCGFGLSRLVICQREIYQNTSSLLNQFEIWQIQNQLLNLKNVKYNILNQKVLNQIFTI